MGCENKTWLLLHLLFFVACYLQQYCVKGQTSQVPCLFIFGDSLTDCGNNNVLHTTSKVNFKPYGIDFVEGPTGRYTNGRTSIDIIGQLLGFEEFIPPFVKTVGSDILKGVNYASGVAGIRNETGTHTGAYNFAFGKQIENHKTIITQIAAKLGGLTQATNYLKKCIYYVNIGSDDYINNYFKPQFYSTSGIYNPEQYAQVLINQLFLYLQDLYSNGARKLVLVGVGELGCTPHAIATADGVCVAKMNDDVEIFNLKLKSLVDQLNILHLDSKHIFINSFLTKLEGSLGFKVINAPCCATRPEGKCVADSIPCPNRNEYAFFDGFHPTQVANEIDALASYDSTFNPDATYPMDIKHLAKLPIL